MISTDWADTGRGSGIYGGVTHYRLKNPAKFLKKMGYEVDIYADDFSDAITGGKKDLSQYMIKKAYREFIIQYDIVISKVIDNKFAAGALVAACKDTKTPLIIDLDDNVLEVQPDQPAYQNGFHPGGASLANAIAFISCADALFCSTQPLGDYMAKWLENKWQIRMPVYILPNTIDTDIWSDKFKHNKDSNVIGWCGSITHDADIAMVLPELIAISRKYQEIRFEFMGGFTASGFQMTFPDTPKEFLDKCNFKGGTPGWNGFPELLQGTDWLLGICPIVDNEFNRSKSHIKWLEYALASIPSVVSLVYPYVRPIHETSTVVGNDTGYIAKNNKWFRVLDRALSDRDKLHEVAYNAWDDVRANWHMKNFIHLWDEAIQEILYGSK